MAEDVAVALRQAVERVLEADVTDQIARRGREIAASVNEATDAVSARATKAWIESEPQRREVEKNARRASRDALRWSRKTWKKEVRPALKDLWSRRGPAVAATAAAATVGREAAEDAAVRLGVMKRREGRHWGLFFFGLLLGAAAGAVVAMLTTPKDGGKMRDELAVRARDAADKARNGAGEWMPLFQRDEAEGEAAVDAIPSEGNEDG